MVFLGFSMVFLGFSIGFLGFFYRFSWFSRVFDVFACSFQDSRFSFGLLGIPFGFDEGFLGLSSNVW